MQTQSIPAKGQLVTVRQRQFVVTDVKGSQLEPDPLRPIVERTGHHLVSLSSVDDEGLGETMQVIWELEPGVHIRENSELPDPTHGFDTPKRLDAFLDAVRWGAIASAEHNSLHAPFRSGIEIEDYQLDPVVRALDMPRVNLLIADDVGLGKTIEAGLVVQELMLRNRVRTVLVICPASLQLQWRDQMRDKFGLEFRIVDRQLMKDLRRRRGLHVNPWNHFPRLITSIDFLKRENVRRLFQELLPPGGKPSFPRKFDLMIIDEAHNIAPSGSGSYAVDSQRTATVRMLAPHFEHKLFLSATPHNGYKESFTALLELLDNQRFHREVTPDKAQLANVMVRRLKSELIHDWSGKPRFAERKIIPLEVAYTEEERQIHRELHNYTKLRIKNAQNATESFAAEFVLKLLKKRLFSFPAAFLSTLEKHEDSLENAVRRKKEKKSRSKPTLRILQHQIANIEDDYEDEYAHEELTDEVVDAACRLFAELEDEERQLLDKMLSYARKATEQRDTKAETLLAWLKTHIRPGGKWSTRRVIIFTEYRATQKWLLDVLAAGDIGQNNRISLLHGGLSKEEREEVKAGFQTSPEEADVRILLATDAASEGIDLQNFCSDLIHYEIPWNPNRMEQRNGRVDRHGQRASEVNIYHFVGDKFEESKNKIALNRKPGELEDDLEFLMRVATKIESIREDLGKVGPVIASQVEQAMLKGANRELTLENSRTSQQLTKKMLKLERNLRERLKKLDETLKQSRHTLRLTPENIQSVVEVGLALAEQPPLKPVEVELEGPGGKTIRAFEVPSMKGSWARCQEGLMHPYTQAIRPVVFDGDLARKNDKVVHAHLNHTLVQLCLHYLRAEVWSPKEKRRLKRVATRVIPSHVHNAPAVIGYARLLIMDNKNNRLHEELITAGGSIVGANFEELGVHKTKDLLSAMKDEEVPIHIHDDLLDIWPKFSKSLKKSLEKRAKEREKSLKKVIEKKGKAEEEHIRSLLTDLKNHIEQEMKQAEQDLVSSSSGQLELVFTPEEKQQFERNKESLQARIDAIPEEIEREVSAIQKRYEKTTARMFPVAITFLFPQNLVRG